MAIVKREQVFVSSTFKDLVEERAAVIQTLLTANCIPAGMEMFPASDDDKFDLIKRVIDLCDYYVVIVGGRYGSVDPEKELSYTELEFDYAIEKKKPVLAFLHSDPGKLIGDKLDLDSDLRERLARFRHKAEQRMVMYWQGANDLKGQVALAMMHIRESHPVEGWIRAGEAMTPEVRAELVELRARVRELTAELKTEQHNHAGLDAQSLEQGDDEVELKFILDYHKAAEGGGPYNAKRAWDSSRATWNEVLWFLGPELMGEATEDAMTDRLSALCLDLARGDNRKLPKEDRLARIFKAEVGIDSFHDVKVQLAALGLIEKGTKRRPPSDPNGYWTLTPAGNAQLIDLRVRRKTAEVEAEDADQNESDA